MREILHSRSITTTKTEIKLKLARSSGSGDGDLEPNDARTRAEETENKLGPELLRGQFFLPE